MSTIALIILCLLPLGHALNVTIYTAPFEPFSDGGDPPKGYSIDFLNRILDTTFGKENMNKEFISVADNTAIFAGVNGAPATVDAFAIGTCGISITAARADFINFLYPFFPSGFKVLAREKMSFNDVVKKIVRNVFLSFGLFTLGIFVIIYTFGPLAWFCEYTFSGDEVPIFYTDDKEEEKSWLFRFAKKCSRLKCCACWTACAKGWKNCWTNCWKLPQTPSQKTPEEKEFNHANFPKTVKALRMLQDVWKAWMWTAYTLLGTQTGYPSSMPARAIHTFLKILRVLLMLVAMGTMATVMDVSQEGATINNYADLAGKTICVDIGTTPNDYLRNHNLGFTLNEFPTMGEMFDGFRDGLCDAIVYDFPALQQAIVTWHNEGAGVNGKIVGEVFNEENYGIVTKFGNPHEATLDKAVINLVSNHAEVDALKSRWFSEIEGVTGGDTLTVPVALIVVPSVLGMGLLISPLCGCGKTTRRKTKSTPGFKKRDPTRLRRRPSGLAETRRGSMAMEAGRCRQNDGQGDHAVDHAYCSCDLRRSIEK